MTWAQAARAVLAIMVLLGLSTLSLAQEEGASQSQVGARRITFTERSPHSRLTKIAQRMGIQTPSLLQRAEDAEYTLARKSFEMYVPPRYTGQEPYGLLIWVSPGSTVGMPPGWTDVLDKHKRIWIGANNSGNDRLPLIRMALALDAAIRALAMGA